jgi:hypothetical protein
MILLDDGFKSKEDSLIAVGVDRPEFTPLERGKSLDEGGSPQVGGGRPWEDIMLRYRKSTSGRRSSGDRALTCGRRSRGDIWGLLVRKKPPNQVGRNKNGSK